MAKKDAPVVPSVGRSDLSREQAKKKIVDALLKLRSILTQATEQRYPRGLREHPGVMQEVSAIESVLREAGVGEPGQPGPLNPDFHVVDFVECFVLPWKRLPLSRLQRHEREVLDTIDYSIEKLGGQVAAADKPEQDGPWSKPDTPTRWALQFQVGPATFKRWVKTEKIRAKKLSDRSYQVHLADLPQPKPAEKSSHK